MEMALNDAQLEMQRSIREYLTERATPELFRELRQPDWAEGGGPEFRRQYARMGADGWIGLSWPKSEGGREWSAVEQYIFTDEVVRSGFPYPFLTTEAIAPVMMAHAHADIRDAVVGGVRRGEVVIAIGYSEPQAGTDLASLTTRAERDGNDWIITGQKIWTSLGNFADYIWLAVRTDPDPAKRHKGITMFLVPTNSPGFSCTPIWTLGVRTNATYYDAVRLPDCYRVGPVNGGWKLITGQLNRERLSLVTYGQVASLFEEVRDWAAQTPVSGGRLLDRPWVQHNLAQLYCRLEALKLWCWKQAWALDRDQLAMADASGIKVYGTEFFVDLYRGLLEILGQAGTLAADSPGALLAGKLEHRYRCGSILTFGGGTNEVQREIIAAAGLKLPRSR